jgi:tRNA-dihydrouridine synthase
MKLILAPLRGITNNTIRKIYHKHFPFFDYAVAPFVSPTASEKLGNGLLSDLTDAPLPFTEPQILLNNPAVLYSFLDKIYDFGYRKININMGCPAAVVVKKKKGAALLENPDLIDAILEKISNDKRFEFSVKMRLGMTDKNRIFEILPIIEKHKPCEIILHPRTAEMQYSGNADLEYFAKVADIVSVPIIYNGDIFSLAKFQKINADFGNKISGIMIGRGALTNPFLSGEIKNCEIPENPAEKIGEFVSDLYDEYKKNYFGEKPVLGKMKELWKYLRFSFENSEKSVKKILKSNSLYSYEKYSALLFENCKFCNKQILGNIEIDEF